MLVNYHFHDRRSFDAEGTLEENIQEALRFGVKHLGITNHAELRSHVMDLDEMIQRFTEGREECLQLRKKYPELSIAYGYEATADSSVFHLHEALQKAVPFDFVIGSIHWVRGEDISKIMPRISLDSLIHEYFDNMIQALKWGKFTQLGHLDFFGRYVPAIHGEKWQWENYKDILKKIAQEVKQQGIIVELNCAGLFTSGQATNPTPELVEFLFNEGVTQWTLGSDAHAPYEFSQGLKEGEKVFEKLEIVPVVHEIH